MTTITLKNIPDDLYERLKSQAQAHRRSVKRAEGLLGADPDWIAPILWRSELRNVLALYLRKGLITLEGALSLQLEAEALLRDQEYEVGARDVLTLVERSPCSAYDCEFVPLARSFGVKLVTMDRRVIKAFPDTAVALGDFLAGGR